MEFQVKLIMFSINRLYFWLYDKTRAIFDITVDVEFEDSHVTCSALGILNWIIKKMIIFLNYS